MKHSTPVVIIASEKGGQGRTTHTKNLAAGLAALGYRVAVIDTDGQGSLTYELKIQVDVTIGEPVLFDWLMRNRPFSDVIRQVPAEYYQVPDCPTDGALYVVPSNAETMLVGALNTDSSLLRSRLLQMKQARHPDGGPLFHIILIDTSPTPAQIHPPIYMAGDAILFVTETEDSPIKGLRDSIDHLAHAQVEREGIGLAQIEVIGILPNKVRTTGLHELCMEELVNNFDAPIWEPVGLSTVWGEASYLKKPVFCHKPASVAAEQAWGVILRVEAALLKDGGN